MADQLFSILAGTTGLTIAAAAAYVLSRSQRPTAASIPAVRRMALLAVAVQAGHFAEEYLTGFPHRFPGLLGLSPWPVTFFVTFNVAWIAAWLGCIAVLTRLPHAAGFALWFLAIASTANGVAHPLMALAAGGYFPGLWTSPLSALAGVLLIRALASSPGVRRRRACGP